MLHSYRWHYIINLPTRKLTDFAKQLSERKQTAQAIPGQPSFRKRRQQFYWNNYICDDWRASPIVHLVACQESYEQANRETGEIETHHSQHTWISSIPLSIDNVHELLNLGARQKALMEDSINTEKNRGYRYKHAFSYHWNGAQGFHYLMRLAHAINALSEFTKVLKRYIKSLGVSATLKLIKETLFNPWLPLEWYEAQT